MGYQIKCGEYLLHDVRLADDGFIVQNPKCTLEVNTVGTASFSVFAEHPNYGCMKKLRSVFEVLQDGETIFRGRMTEDTRDFDNTKLVNLEGVLAFFNDSVVRPFHFPEDWLEDADYITAAKSGNVIKFFLKWLIDNHNEQVEGFQRFKMGRVTVTDPNNYLDRYSDVHINTWEVLKTRLFDSTLGGYLCIRYEADGNYIDYLEDFDFVNSQPIEYGENLLDLSCESDASETYSAIIPIGAEVEVEVSKGTVEGKYVDFELTETVKEKITISGLPDGNITNDIVKKGDTLYSKSAVNQYGWICAPVSETTWDDVTVAENLQSKGVDFLANRAIRLTNTITIKAVDLHFSDEEIESFRIYEYVDLLSKPHNQEDSLKLTRLDIDIQNPQNTIITIGETRLSMTHINARSKMDTEKRLENVLKVISPLSKTAITKSVVYYYLSTSETELVGGSWEETPPAWVDGCYYWQLVVTTLADGTTTEGSPVCITGGKGSTGVGVKSIKTIFYLSTSKTERIGGDWTDYMPDWSVGFYLWTRSLITYTDGSTDYTEPICDSSWEVANEVKEELREEFTSKFEQFADEITLEITGSLGSVASIVMTAGGVEHKTELELDKVREAFANDDTAIDISAGLITFNSGTIVINSENFKVSSAGVIEAKDAVISGEIITIDEPFKTELKDGSIKLYYNDAMCGTINTKYWTGATNAGISLRVEEEGNYIMFCSPNSDHATGFQIDYFLNCGWSPNTPYKHNFQSSVLFTDTVHFSGTGAYFYANAYLRNSTFIKSVDSNGNVGEEMLGFSSNMVTVGSVGCPLMLRGTTVYLKNTNTVLTSDRNAKNSIEALPDVYEAFIDSLEPVRFKYNEGRSGRYHVGYIAQDVEAALTSAGLTAKDFAGYVDIEGTGELGLAYDEFIAILHRKIKRLENRIAALENN